MVRAIEKETRLEYNAKKIEGGYEVYTLEGEKYKKLKDSTFKRYFKILKDAAPAEEPAEEPVTEEDFEDVTPEPQEEPEVDPEETKEEEEPKAEKPKKSKKSQKKAEPVEELTGEDRESMIEKIKKTLNLSKNNPSAEEGIAAALKAQQLMAKYNIHEDEVTLEEIKNEISWEAAVLKDNSSLHTWRKPLANTVAKNFRVKCYTQNKKDVVFRGYKNDVEIAKEVFLYLYTLGDKLGSKAYHDALSTKGSGKGVYNSFVLGFLQGVEDGLGEQCTALMLVTPKEVEEEYAIFAETNLKSTKININASKDKNFEDGVREGQAAVKSRQLTDKKKGKK